MKKTIFFILLVTIICSKSYAKMMDLNSKVLLNVPNSHNYIKFEDDEMSSAFYGSFDDLLDEFQNLDLDIELYMVAPNAVIEIVEKVIDGAELEDLDFIKPLIKKAERKSFSSEKSQMKWLVSELKKILKKEKVEYFTYVIISSDKFIDLEDSNELKEIIDAHNQMTKNELKEITKEYRKEMTSLSRDNKSIPINEDTSIIIQKFEISKDNNGQLYLIMNAKVNWMNTIQIPFNIYFSKFNDYLYLIVSECWLNCSKQVQRFNRMIKPMLVKSSNDQNIIKKNNSDIVEDLKQLNDLYKSGALTKEEFEKAKKKIIN